MLFIKECILFSHIAKMTAVDCDLLNFDSSARMLDDFNREVSSVCVFISEKSYNYDDVCKESNSEFLFHSYLHYYNCDFGIENNKPCPSSTTMDRGVLFNHMPTKTIYSNYGEIWFESRNMVERNVQKNLTGNNSVAAPDRWLTLEKLDQYCRCLTDKEIKTPANNNSSLSYIYGEDWAVGWLKFQGDMNAWCDRSQDGDKVSEVIGSSMDDVAAFDAWMLYGVDQFISSHTPYFIKHLWNRFSSVVI